MSDEKNSESNDDSLDKDPVETQSPDSGRPESTPQLLQLTYPKAVSFDRGLGWIIEGFSYFQKSPGPWIMTVLTLFALFILASLIPILGQALVGLSHYVFVGGLMLGCKAQYEGQPFDVKYLFASFKQGPLATFVVAALIANLVSTVLFYSIIGDLQTEMAKLQTPEKLVEYMKNEQVAETLLWAFLAMIPVMMATFFAPVLIALHRVSIVKAFEYSFMGCFRNLLPFLLYSLLLFGFAIIATMPMFLGWLILVPVAYASTFVAYRDIFTQPHIVNDHMVV